jgi:phage shock protein A
VSVSDRILSSTRVLESKIYEARNKKDLLKARAQSAKTSKEVNEVLGSVDTTSALSAYKRMEEKGTSRCLCVKLFELPVGTFL